MHIKISIELYLMIIIKYVLLCECIYLQQQKKLTIYLDTKVSIQYHLTSLIIIFVQ